MYVRTLSILRFVRWNFELAFKFEISINFHSSWVTSMSWDDLCYNDLVSVFCLLIHVAWKTYSERVQQISSFFSDKNDLSCTSLGECKGQNDVVSTKGFAWHVLPDLESISPMNHGGIVDSGWAMGGSTTNHIYIYIGKSVDYCVSELFGIPVGIPKELFRSWSRPFVLDFWRRSWELGAGRAQQRFLDMRG